MQKLSFRRISYLLHLWLGLISGLVIFIVAITGCIYAFQSEINDLLDPQQKLVVQAKEVQSPTELRAKASQYLASAIPNSEIELYGVYYQGQDKPASVSYNDPDNGYSSLLLNPYTGEYVGKKVYKEDFFSIVLAGHRSLWLPYQVGHLIVGWSIVVFVVVLLSGLILWIPRKWNKKSAKASLTIKTKGKWFKKMYDFHNVLGFYIIIPALLIAITGLTWSFSWFSESYYSLISGGDKLQQWEPAVSDTTNIAIAVDNPDLVLWERVSKEYPLTEPGTLSFDFPKENTGTYRVGYNPSENGSTYYKRHFRFFDRYTTKEVPGGGFYGISYDNSTNAQKLYRMTYDIHVGSIWGMTGRIIVFIVSLIIASLPVTGLYLWLKKKKKKKK